VLKTTQLSAHAQNHASPERCRKSFTLIVLGDHDIPLTGSNFGNVTAFTAIFSRATCRRFDTIPACDGRTDRQTADGIAVANIALAMGALRAL